MTIESSDKQADEKSSIAAIYEDQAIANSYLDKRRRFSWQRLLHARQIASLNGIIAAHVPRNVLELAPGPARLSVELLGIQRGVMVENSEEMIALARARLRQHGLEDRWQVIPGDAFKLSTLVSRQTFELAYTFRFLRHFRDSDRQHLYGLIRDALKPGGLLVIDVVNAATLARVEAGNRQKPADEIDIYDVGYSVATFSQEMARNGFNILELVPVIRNFWLQAAISYKLDDVVPRLASRAVALLEKLPSPAPLEWVAICRKM